MSNRTFALIKPDAFDRQDEISKEIEKRGFKIQWKLLIGPIGPETWEAFYMEHRGKSFYGRLIDHMMSGPVIALILEKEDAITEWRKEIGSSDPKAAAPWTLRAKYGSEIPRNAFHGSDSEESYKREWQFFFTQADMELLDQVVEV